MPRVYKPKPGHKVFRNYESGALDEAVKAVEAGMSQRLAAKEFKVPRGTLQNRLQGKHPGKYGGQPVFSNEEEISFATHLSTLADWGFPVGYLETRLLVKAYIDKCGRTVRRFKQNLPSVEWVRSFLKRQKNIITTRFCQNIKRARAQVSPKIINKYFDNLENTLEDIPAKNILNYDETNLSDDPGKNKCIFRRGVKYPERVMNSTKSSTSVMFASTGAGELLPPYVVYKATHLMNTWTEGGPSKARYNRSKSGWFDAHSFSDWFMTVTLPWAKRTPGRKVIIGDNLSSHMSADIVDICIKNNISFVCLPPNSTHLTQPLDVSVYASMKRNWRDVLGKWKESPAGHKCATIPKDSFPRLLKTLLEKMKDVMKENIISGFRKTGIFPVSREQVLSRLPSRTRIEDEDLSPEVVSDVFVEHLERLRYPEGEPAVKRRRRVQVQPGKSISLEDFQAGANTASGSAASTSRNGGTEEQNRNDEPEEQNSNSSDESGAEDAEVAEEAHEAETPEEQPTTDQTDDVDDDDRVAANKWVLVKFSVRRRSLHYVGQVLRSEEESSSDSSESDDNSKYWEVDFFRKSGKIRGAFVKPHMTDIAFVKEQDIITVLPEPKKNKRNHYSFPNVSFDGFNMQ